MLDLFPVSARVDSGALSIGGVPAARLAEEFGTPLVVYCEETVRTQARAYAHAAPGALVVYGTKAFANIALLRVLGEEGVGADVSTLGELEFAKAAGIPRQRPKYVRAIIPRLNMSQWAPPARTRLVGHGQHVAVVPHG